MAKEAEREQLVAALRRYGVRFLAPSDPQGEGDLSPQDLVARLVAHGDARLRLALISLFLLHPEWGEQVPTWLPSLEPSVAQEIKIWYQAAVYLQRLWWTRLGLYLGDFPPLPDWFSQELGLPSAQERQGKKGLYALADWHRQHSPYPFNRLASYQRAVELLIGQLKGRRNHGASSRGSAED